MVDISEVDVSSFLMEGSRGVNPADPLLQEEMKTWMSYANENIAKKDHSDDSILALVSDINMHLRLRTFFVGHHVTMADIHMWKALRDCPQFNDGSASRFPKAVHTLRWYHSMTKLIGEKKDTGIDLPGAVMGKVVTRFPPEPSGYLHIGHAKAAMMNYYFAKRFKGKMLLRMDDTNPSKEKGEFIDNIMQDLKTLKVEHDSFSHTSDYFPQFLEACTKMIREGKAYLDDTDVETMRQERGDCIESRRRNESVELNLQRWAVMQTGSDEGRKWCVRAKIDMKSVNGALRDPVMYRCNLTPHPITKDKYKVYPTYDFACPLIDSWEGVTHALRTTEYHDRNAQYYWVCDAMGIRKPIIYDFSRLNMMYTLMSKRKLQQCVDMGIVDGWYDPRFPTVQGIMRRGLLIDALYEFILIQGASKNINLMEWHSLWTINKRLIDPVAPRYNALNLDGRVVLEIEGVQQETKTVPKHRKNPDVGTKEVLYGPRVWLDGADADSVADNEEITLMSFGNVILTEVVRADGHVTSLKGKFNPGGDFKKSKKFTWLTVDPENAVPATLVVVEHILTKKKLDEDDDFEKFLNRDSWKETKVVIEKAAAATKKSQHIQFERRGFYICDKEEPLTFIYVPDGSNDDGK